jgi:two-component system chemotaxis response regulator CheB
MAQDSLKNYSLVVIGGSAGSLEVALRIVAQLPSQTNAAIVLVLHRKYSPDSILAHIVAARTSLPVKEVEDKESLLPGTIYIAPPDYHLLLEDRQNFSLDSSEKVHYSRPSIDVTFESAAEIFGKEAIGILLSGANADGAAGLLKMKQGGGHTIVQDPASAEVNFMPQQALLLDAEHAVVHTDKLPDYVRQLLAGNRNQKGF